MSRRRNEFKPPSLAQHYEAPDEYVGYFGWICGYSGDAGFLDDAAERFTRRTTAQRAYEGRIALTVMLDPSNPQILPADVPGVLHLPIKGDRPFRLLHAKVALLAFRHTADTKRWKLRLIVSTGNWTRSTLEDSLDLAWRIDISREEIRDPNDHTAQNCSDLAAAWKMFLWLQKYFDDRAINAAPGDRPNSERESRIVAKWITKAMALGRDATPRFFDNRSDSFLGQLPEMIRNHCADSARNYLALGSGFYESDDSHDQIPSVLLRIVQALQEENFLTQHPEIDVFVNPNGCQAVAGSVSAFTEAGWVVRAAGQPEYFKSARSLHAKFIFGAINRDNSPWCNSAWLYLGSGNLSGPGFANSMTPYGGNLEAGVVFVPEALRWHDSKDAASESVVTNLLPLQWDSDLNHNPTELSAGADMPEPTVEYTAAPVACLFWKVEDAVAWLNSEATNEPIDVLNADGLPCSHDASKGYLWPGARPRQVQLRWHFGSDERRAWVPVIDEYGRVAATILPRIDIAEAWDQLANFPMPPEDEELLPDGDDEVGDSRQASSGASSAASYPVRQMMQLVENIAAKQISVPRDDWGMWCARLEQCLTQAKDSQVLQEFKTLKLNPLSPLRHSPFRPEFATNGETKEGHFYEESLNRIEAAWEVSALRGIGDLT